MHKYQAEVEYNAMTVTVSPTSAHAYIIDMMDQLEDIALKAELKETNAVLRLANQILQANPSG